MSKERVFRITTVEGARVAFKACWQLFLTLKFERGFELVLRPLKIKRTLPQNKRYHAILRELAGNAWLDDSQFTEEAWAEYFKRKFIGTIELPGGDVVGMSTTDLSVEEFTDYMTQIEAWAAENGFLVD